MLAVEEEAITLRRRRGRGAKRWTNPSSPLQAARFEQRWTQDQVVAKIRKLCPGHAGRSCQTRPEKLSDRERRDKKPSLPHIQALCAVYGKSAETLGLITWRSAAERAQIEHVQEPVNGAAPGSAERDDLRAHIERDVRAAVERDLRIELVRDFRALLQQEVYAALATVLLRFAGLGDAPGAENNSSSEGETGMDLDGYQRAAYTTAQRFHADRTDPVLMPLLRLGAAAGSLLGEYERVGREGQDLERFKHAAALELGGLLWYAAGLASRLDLRLTEVARLNLMRNRARWHPPPAHFTLFDDHLPSHEQLPRQFTIRFTTITVDGRERVRMLLDGQPVGDREHDDRAGGRGAHAR